MSSHRERQSIHDYINTFPALHIFHIFFSRTYVQCFQKRISATSGLLPSFDKSIQTIGMKNMCYQLCATPHRYFFVRKYLGRKQKLPATPVVFIISHILTVVRSHDPLTFLPPMFGCSLYTYSKQQLQHCVILLCTEKLIPLFTTYQLCLK